MKKNLFILSFSIFIFVCLAAVSSCSKKAAFPRDPYRGASNNPNSYPQKHDKAKRTRSYRAVHVRPTYYK